MVTVALVAILLTVTPRCTKTTSGGGNPVVVVGALLTEIVTIGYNASGAVLDSQVVTIQYNADSQIVQTFQLRILHVPGGATDIDTLSTAYTYSGIMISSTAQTITTQTNIVGQPPAGFDEQLNTTFNASGGLVTSLTQMGTITSYGINPPENGTVQFSGVLTHNTNSSVSSFTDSSATNGGPFSPLFVQTFTYSGNNLAGDVLTNTNPLAPSSTTTTYTYNSHLSAAPFYNVVTGINLPSANDVSELTLVETGGLYPGQTIYSYASIYNSFNQPTSSSVIISTTVTNQAYLLLTPTTESIYYYYQ